jgi:uncharacterized protein YcbK (DUF882 family)
MLALVTPSSVRASSLRGSHASQKKQNKEADREKLTRIETDAQLQKFKQAGLLVQLPQNEAVQIDDRLEQKWRWCRPWTAIFLRDLGKSYFAEFHESLQVNSAVRTIEYQQQLHKYNGNAAGTTGDRQSSHPTGATIDIAKKELNHEQLKWMRKRLLSFEKQNVIEATEEKKQSVFHIMVFNTYRNVKRPIHTPSR